MVTAGKAAHAFRTIGEVAADTGVPQHVLRYWEGRFPELRPVTRAGNRRYYRPEDIALVRRIADLLHHQGYTIRGVQKLLDGEGQGAREPVVPASSAVDLAALRRIRDMLAAALADERPA